MKKIMLAFSILSSMILINGCASSSSEQASTERPDWIDHAEVKYPNNEYLTAVGESSNRTRSGKSAVANLAEIFSVNISAETKILTKAIKEQSKLGVTSESSTSLERNIESETKQSIEGVEIKESWLSPNGEYFTLAVLHKRSAAQNLTETIMESDKKIADLIEYSLNTAPNSILAINALRSARDKQLSRDMAELQLKYITGGGIPNEFTSQKIERLISRHLASLKVSVNIDDKQQKEILQSALSTFGVQVVDGKAEMQLSSALDMNIPTVINDWYWLRGSYELNMLENGKVISRKRWSIKVSARQADLLMPRLQDKLTANINKYLQELISDSPSL